MVNVQNNTQPGHEMYAVLSLYNDVIWENISHDENSGTY